jgi:hypothetical protein
MALSYNNLTNAIDEYTANTTWGRTTTQKDNIIRLAENRINNDIQVANFNTKVATGNIGDQANSVALPDTGPGVSATNVTAPISPLYFKIRAGTTGSPVTTNNWEFLLLKDYNFLQEYAPVTDNSTDGTPKYYSFYNDTGNDLLATFGIAPRSDAAYEYEILYLFQPVSIVSDTSGTWLSTHAESALLYGCLVEAYTFMKGEAELIQLYDAKYKEALQSVVNIQGGTFRNSTYRDRSIVGAV